MLLKYDTIYTSVILEISEAIFFSGGLELSRAHLLYEDLYKAQASLVLQSHLHLLYLVTPYDTAEQIRPNMQVYYDLVSFNVNEYIELFIYLNKLLF